MDLLEKVLGEVASTLLAWGRHWSLKPEPAWCRVVERTGYWVVCAWVAVGGWNLRRRLERIRQCP